MPHLEKEDGRDQEGESGRPAEQHAWHLPDERGEGGKRVEAQQLEGGDGGGAGEHGGDEEGGVAGDDRLLDVEQRDRHAEE